MAAAAVGGKFDGFFHSRISPDQKQYVAAAATQVLPLFVVTFRTAPGVDRVMPRLAAAAVSKAAAAGRAVQGVRGGAASNLFELFATARPRGSGGQIEFHPLPTEADTEPGAEAEAGAEVVAAAAGGTSPPPAAVARLRRALANPAQLWLVSAPPAALSGAAGSGMPPPVPSACLLLVVSLDGYRALGAKAWVRSAAAACGALAQGVRPAATAVVLHTRVGARLFSFGEVRGSGRWTACCGQRAAGSGQWVVGSAGGRERNREPTTTTHAHIRVYTLRVHKCVRGRRRVHTHTAL
jgi:hypothetical protein